jgi:hypothetical protein
MSLRPGERRECFVQTGPCISDWIKHKCRQSDHEHCHLPLGSLVTLASSLNTRTDDGGCGIRAANLEGPGAINPA